MTSDLIWVNSFCKWFYILFLSDKLTNCVGILHFDRQLHLSLAFSSLESTRANWPIFQTENLDKANFAFRFRRLEYLLLVHERPWTQVSGRSCDIEFDQVSQHTRVSSTLLLQSDLRCEAKTALIIYHLQPLPCFWSSRWQIARRINSSSDPGQLMVAIKCKWWLAIIFDFSASVCIYWRIGIRSRKGNLNNGQWR